MDWEALRLRLVAALARGRAVVVEHEFLLSRECAVALGNLVDGVVYMCAFGGGRLSNEEARVICRERHIDSLDSAERSPEEKEQLRRTFDAAWLRRRINKYKGCGMLSTDCKNQSLRDRVDYKFDCRLQSSEFREPDFLLWTRDYELERFEFFCAARGHFH